MQKFKSRSMNTLPHNDIINSNYKSYIYKTTQKQTILKKKQLHWIDMPKKGGKKEGNKIVSLYNIKSSCQSAVAILRATPFEYESRLRSVTLVRALLGYFPF